MIPVLQVLANCQHQSQHGPAYRVGSCKLAVREAYEVRVSHSGSAHAAWTQAAHKHRLSDPGRAPKGAPVFWSGGTHGYGHVAVSAGDGRIWSTDIERLGYFDLVPASAPATQWGLVPLGWTNDLDGVLVYQEKPMPKRPNFDAIYEFATKAVEGNKKNPKAAEAARIIAQIAAAFRTPSK